MKQERTDRNWKWVGLSWGGSFGNCSVWGSPKRPKINWSAVGPVNLAVAEDFAHRILNAVRLGRKIKGSK